MIKKKTTKNKPDIIPLLVSPFPIKYPNNSINVVYTESSNLFIITFPDICKFYQLYNILHK